MSWDFVVFVNPVSDVRCLGLCCSSSQPTSSLYSLTQRGVTKLCQLTNRLLARQVTVSVKSAWCFLLVPCKLNLALLTPEHNTNMLKNKIQMLCLETLSYLHRYIFWSCTHILPQTIYVCIFKCYKLSQNPTEELCLLCPVLQWICKL